MKVTNYKDADGFWYREMRAHDFRALAKLKEAYADHGYRTWLVNYEGTEWALTVQAPPHERRTAQRIQQMAS